MRWFICLALLFAFSTAAEIPAPVRDLPEVQRILSNKCIRIEADGTAKAAFEDLLIVSGRPDLLSAVQRTYAEMLPEGEAPEFTVEEVAPGQYFYLNRKDQESHVTELLRAALPDGRLHAVYNVSGERFFGDFQAVVHVGIAKSGTPGEVDYFAEVYAWPENSFSRFLARGLTFAIEAFFDRKTKHMTGLILDICAKLVEEEKLARLSTEPVDSNF